MGLCVKCVCVELLLRTCWCCFPLWVALLLLQSLLLAHFQPSLPDSTDSPSPRSSTDTERDRQKESIQYIKPQPAFVLLLIVFWLNQTVRFRVASQMTMSTAISSLVYNMQMSWSCSLCRSGSADIPESSTVHPREVWQNSDGSLITREAKHQGIPCWVFSSFQLSTTLLLSRLQIRQPRNKQQGVLLFQKETSLCSAGCFGPPLFRELSLCFLWFLWVHQPGDSKMLC